MLQFMGSQRVRHDWVTEKNNNGILFPSSKPPPTPGLFSEANINSSLELSFVEEVSSESSPHPVG